jgi:uncharacterized OB-fold protein
VSPAPRLEIQRCDDCGHHQWYPRPFCLSCRGSSVSIGEASGRGVLHSFTTVMRSPSKDLEPGYTVALVDLEEGVRIVSWYVGSAEPVCDLPVTVTWLDDGRHAFTAAP